MGVSAGRHRVSQDQSKRGQQKLWDAARETNTGTAIPDWKWAYSS
jgi:hypothetical protein